MVPRTPVRVSQEVADGEHRPWLLHAFHVVLGRLRELRKYI